MKNLRFSIVPALVGISLTLFANSGLAQVLPPALKAGMPYSQARKLLIKNGWEPIVNQQSLTDVRRSGIVTYLAQRKGYTEVVDCSGTGVGFCLFEFRNANSGQRLSIITNNNSPGKESTVVRWRKS